MKRLTAVLAAIGLCAGLVLPASAADLNATETQIGQQEYQQLLQKGEIIRESPYYNILTPIAERIKRIADPQYYRPFTFILVHEKAPNAFAVPGGNVYVTDSMMTFVKNKEELAGVLCHETSHDIHHDVVHLMQKDQNLAIGATVLELLLGGGRNSTANGLINLGANIGALSFSRPVEEAADLKGSDTCAEAGFNPWGMVWLFQQFEKADTGGQMEALSDHPTDAHRISALEAHFRQYPALFGRYSPNIATATPLTAASAGTPSYSRYRQTRSRRT